MKTTKTFLAILLIAGISNITLAQGGLLGKAKDAAKNTKKVDTKKVDPKATKTGKTGKGGKDDMAIKGSGVPTNSTEKTNTAPASTNTNK